MIRIKKGLNIPLEGSPKGAPVSLTKPRSVGLVGSDYNGMKPTMLVDNGDQVKIGQPLFEDKKNQGVIYTSPGAGKIQSINRGSRRALQSIVIDLDQDEKFIEFNSYLLQEIKLLDSISIKNQLVKSGLWVSFKTRPFSKTPKPSSSSPDGLFVTAMDTNPLSLDPNQIINLEKNNFMAGLNVLRSLVSCPIYLCVSGDFNKQEFESEDIFIKRFSGPHPAGLAGTHIHFISPATINNNLWTINYSDVIGFGSLFLTGKLSTDKYISIAGPQVEEPKIAKTRIGVCIDEICAGQLKPADNRVISGSVINGREAIGPFSYLGKFHNQISVIEETNSSDRRFLNWLMPGFNKHSQIPLFGHTLTSNKKLNMKTFMNGSSRSILPIGVYEEIFPFEILISILLRYIVVGDTEKIQALGGLELDIEDLALCSYVCPSKYDFGSLLNKNLTLIETEG